MKSSAEPTKAGATQPQTHRFHLAPDMTAEITFISPDNRPYSLRDLMHLIAQIDMQRAMLAGDSIDTAVSLSTPQGQRTTTSKAGRAAKEGTTVTFPPEDATPTPASRRRVGGTISSLFTGRSAASPPAEPGGGTDDGERRDGTG